jgi:hypothetical protein
MTEEKIKIRWKRSRRGLEVLSIVGGAVAVIGLWQEGLRDWGAALVWIGVFIEVFGSFWMYGVSRRIEKFDAEELEEMRLKTAEAEKSLESERLARLTLEEKLAPRRLSGEAFHRIALRLKLREPSATVPIFVCRYDSEVMRFASDLGDVLSGAGWHVGKGGLKTYDRITLGVWIETATNASTGDSERADELEQALQAEQIAVQRWYKVRVPSLRSPEVTDAALNSPVQILIGEKP